MVEEFYTIEQVAELSNKSQKTVRRHIAANKLIASKSQNKYRILKSEYERWINSDDSKEELNRETFAKIDYQNNTYDDIVNWIDITDDWKKMDGVMLIIEMVIHLLTYFQEQAD